MLAMCKGSTTVAQQAARKQGVALNAAISYSCRICASSWTSRLVGRGLSSSSLPRVVSGNLHDPMGYHNIGSGTTLLQQQDQQLPNTRSARLGRTRSPAAVQPDSCVVPVAAIHAAQTIDLNRIMMPTIKKADNILERQSQVKQMFGKNSIVIRLTDSSSSNSSGGPMIESSLDEATTPRFAAIFRFGSIVYFNVTPADADQMTCEIKKCYATEPVLKGMERKENFGVLVAPTTTTRREEDLDPSTLSATAVDADPVEHSFRNVVEPAVAYVTGDYCMVPEQLDMNGVAVISTIMAQTVALDSYSDTVDELLTNFARINSTVSKTGSFTSTDKSFLFKTVAQNNSIFIDMISKVRIKDRSDTAWNLTKYETIHYGLKEEFVSGMLLAFWSSLNKIPKIGMIVFSSITH